MFMLRYQDNFLEHYTYMTVFTCGKARRSMDDKMTIGGGGGRSGVFSYP